MGLGGGHKVQLHFQKQKKKAIGLGSNHLSPYTFIIHECFKQGVCGNDKETKDML